nr:MAG TPA: hypothetical protein [Caudoviricetes sp.]
MLYLTCVLLVEKVLDVPKISPPYFIFLKDKFPLERG